MMNSIRGTEILEQEVKEAEPGKKAKKSTTKEATETKAEAMAQKSDAEEAAARAAPAASAASTAVGRWTFHHEKSRGSICSDCCIGSARNRRKRWKNYGPRTRKDVNCEDTKKKKTVKSAKRSKSVSETKRRKDKKKSQDLGRSQRYKEHVQYQTSEEANPHPQNQEQRRLNYQYETGNRKRICEILWRLVWRWRRLHRRRYGLAHLKMKNRSQPTQLHPRVY